MSTRIDFMSLIESGRRVDTFIHASVSFDMRSLSHSRKGSIKLIVQDVLGHIELRRIKGGKKFML